MKVAGHSGLTKSFLVFGEVIAIFHFDLLYCHLTNKSLMVLSLGAELLQKKYLHQEPETANLSICPVILDASSHWKPKGLYVCVSVDVILILLAWLYCSNPTPSRSASRLAALRSNSLSDTPLM